MSIPAPSLGTYARYLHTVGLLGAKQREIDELSTQLSTEKKSTNLTAYGTETRKLLDLRASKLTRENYLNVAEHVSPRLKAYDLTLSRIGDLAHELSTGTALPSGPGTPRIADISNPKPGTMEISVNSGLSTFKQNATYTVQATPSQNPNNPSGSYDVTISDGFGGVATGAVNLNGVPPSDGTEQSFNIVGGPGDGAVLNLDFHTLTGPGVSSFKVNYPEVNAIRDRIMGALDDVKSMLNERVGDRYIYAGARFSTEPVRDLTAVKQVTQVTINGTNSETGDMYELTVGGKRFTYEPLPSLTQESPITSQVSTSSIADNFAAQINAYNTGEKNAGRPGLGVTAVVNHSVITLTSDNPGKTFPVNGQTLYNNPGAVHNVTGPTTAQPFVDGIAADPYTNPPIAAVPATRQVDKFTFNGPQPDLNDVFAVTINNHRFAVQITEDNQASYASVSDVTNDLISQINNSKDNAGVSARLGTNGEMVLTGGPSAPFSTKANVSNSIDNTMTVQTLPSMAQPANLDINATEPDLPEYDTEYAKGKPSPAAWTRSKAAVGDHIEMSYGLTSTDPAFQRLVTALKTARAAVDNPGDYSKYMDKARDLLVEATGKIRGLQADVAVNLSRLKEIQDDHKQYINNISEEVSGIEGIDKTEIAARLQNAMTVQEATYTVIGKTASMSLVNFLS
ncbi:putative Flagellin_D0/D1 domain-containing protein [Azospirillaceae bacterium]